MDIFSILLGFLVCVGIPLLIIFYCFFILPSMHCETLEMKRIKYSLESYNKFKSGEIAEEEYNERIYHICQSYKGLITEKNLIKL